MLLLIGGGLAFIYSGTYDVAASVPENPVFSWILDTTMRNSVSKHAASVPQPPPLDNPQMVEAGAGHYHENCQICHGGPGVERSELAQGLQPLAPDLAKLGQERTPRELFWVAKHGIKATAMPAGDRCLPTQIARSVAAAVRRDPQGAPPPRGGRAAIRSRR
ncbi:MAG: c-type cytochrome [Thiohalocapsa sp.]